MLYFTHDIEIPALHIGRLILESLERNLDLDFVSVIGDASLRAEHEVLTEIRSYTARQCRRPRTGERLSLLDDGAVHLHAQRIHSEHVSLTMIVEGAEQNLHVDRKSVV